MREILFRGKRIDNGEWVEGDFCRCVVAKIDTHKMGQPWRGYTVHEESIGQYTGLKDMNGKRIFEGDIVRYYSTYREEFTGDNCVVEYGVFNCSCCDGVYGWEFKDGDIRCFDDYEVIGNIHDNPELLKEA